MGAIARGGAETVENGFGPGAVRSGRPSQLVNHAYIERATKTRGAVEIAGPVRDHRAIRGLPVRLSGKCVKYGFVLGHRRSSHAEDKKSEDNGADESAHLNGFRFHRSLLISFFFCFYTLVSI